MFVLLNGLVFEMFSNLDTKEKPENVDIHSWESRRQKLITFLGNRLVYGLIFGLLNGVLIGWLGVVNNFFVDLNGRASLSGGIAYGLLNALLIGIGYGLLGKLDTKIQPAEIVSWSWKSLQHNWVKYLVSGLLIGLLYGVLLGLLNNAVIFEIILGLALGLILVLFLLLNSGLSHEMLSKQNIITPNQGIRSSIRNSVFTGLVSGLVTGFAAGLANSVNQFIVGTGLHKGLVFGLVFGLSVGLIFWIRNGGVACILHALLRICLWKAGSVPWNYPRFLDYAVGHILLRRVGGGYIFIHRLLLDYFAALPLAVSDRETEQIPKEIDKTR
jgi:hypothetical protein